MTSGGATALPNNDNSSITSNQPSPVYSITSPIGTVEERMSSCDNPTSLARLYIFSWLLKAVFANPDCKCSRESFIGRIATSARANGAEMTSPNIVPFMYFLIPYLDAVQAALLYSCLANFKPTLDPSARDPRSSFRLPETVVSAPFGVDVPARISCKTVLPDELIVFMFPISPIASSIVNSSSSR